MGQPGKTPGKMCATGGNGCELREMVSVGNNKGDEGDSYENDKD